MDVTVERKSNTISQLEVHIILSPNGYNTLYQKSGYLRTIKYLQLCSSHYASLFTKACERLIMLLHPCLDVVVGI